MYIYIYACIIFLEWNQIWINQALVGTATVKHFINRTQQIGHWMTSPWREVDDRCVEPRTADAIGDAPTESKHWNEFPKKIPSSTPCGRGRLLPWTGGLKSDPVCTQCQGRYNKLHLTHFNTMQWIDATSTPFRRSMANAAANAASAFWLATQAKNSPIAALLAEFLKSLVQVSARECKGIGQRSAQKSWCFCTGQRFMTHRVTVRAHRAFCQNTLSLRHWNWWKCPNIRDIHGMDMKTWIWKTFQPSLQHLATLHCATLQIAAIQPNSRRVNREFQARRRAFEQWAEGRGSMRQRHT